MEILGRQVDRHLRRRFILTMCVVGAIVLIGIGLAVGIGPLAFLGGAFCLVMMASMVWMMVAMARGHGH